MIRHGTQDREKGRGNVSALRIIALTGIGSLLVFLMCRKFHGGELHPTPSLGGGSEMPRQGGVRIANAGSRVIEDLQISFSAGPTYHLKTFTGVREFPDAMTGIQDISFRIVYGGSDAIVFMRPGVTLPTTPQLFQIAIDDGGVVHLR